MAPKSSKKPSEFPVSAYRGPKEAFRVISGDSQGPPESNRLSNNPPPGKPGS